MTLQEKLDKKYIDKSFFVESKFKKLTIQHVKEIINARVIEMSDYLFNKNINLKTCERENYKS